MGRADLSTEARGLTVPGAMRRGANVASTHTVRVPITLPAFAPQGSGCSHFFGTRPFRKNSLCSPRSNGSPGHGMDHGGTAEIPMNEISMRVRPKSVVSVKQVHGTDILVVGRRGGNASDSRGGWDALVTDQDKVLLTVRTADCVPVLVHDTAHGVVAAVHVGWRGAVAGILPKTLSVMTRRFGTNPARVRIGIGPSVGPCCYEVDHLVLTRLRRGFPDWRSIVKMVSSSRALLDLRKLARMQAELAGADPMGIHTVGVCTVCHPRLFYSYRREGTVNGTMVSGVMLIHA